MLSPNTPVEIVDVLYAEGGTKTRRWQAIDFVFKGDEFIRYRLFSPSSYKDRREVATKIRHVFDVLDKSFDDMPYKHNWDEVAVEIIERLKDSLGTKLFAKVIERMERVTLSDELPFLSKEPNLEYTGTDFIYAADGVISASSIKQEETKEKKQPPTRQELVKKRGSGNFTY